jgi:hypothetical protein
MASLAAWLIHRDATIELLLVGHGNQRAVRGDASDLDNERLIAGRKILRHLYIHLRHSRETGRTAAEQNPGRFAADSSRRSCGGKSQR